MTWRSNRLLALPSYQESESHIALAIGEFVGDIE